MVVSAWVVHGYAGKAKPFMDGGAWHWGMGGGLLVNF